MNEHHRKKDQFLNAEWRKLLMANYEVPPALLAPYVPHGTELDLWEGKCYVSLVGFMFLNTKILGWSIPWHRHFEEINLRFYVRRNTGQEWRRGVVFIKEIVPKVAITTVANTVYGEKYVTRQMRHQWVDTPGAEAVYYAWKHFGGNEWNSLTATYDPVARPIEVGSEAEFITEHYWGYSKHQRRTMEYEVRHPRWNAYAVTRFDLQGPYEREYGITFADILRQKPTSVFLAEGSPIEVIKGRLLCVD